jgi:hypothetical protein
MNNRWKDKESTRLRVERFRKGPPCNDDVTEDVTDMFVEDVNFRKENREEKKVTQRKEEYKRKDSYITRAQGEDQEKKQFLECVFLFDKQYQNLTIKYGQFLADKAILILNNYIMGKGKDPYKSHYHTLIGWPMERAREKYGGGARDSCGGPGIQTTPPEWRPETPLSDAEIQANLERVRKLTGGEG